MTSLRLVGWCIVLGGVAGPVHGQSQARTGAPREELASEVRRLRAENDSLRRVLAQRSAPIRADTISKTIVVLSRLESYTAPSAAPSGEPYSSREASGVPVPPKALAFVMDVCQSIKQELDEAVLPLRATPAQVKQIVELYMTRDWTRVPGYRPWTHTHFVRSLDAGERDQLVREIVQTLHSGRIPPREC